MNKKNIYEDLSMLGSETVQPNSPEEAKLEKVPNPQSGTQFNVRFVAPEFTSLCPMTGQPDFAHLVIDYIPKDWLVESKSLKRCILNLLENSIKYAPSTDDLKKVIIQITAYEKNNRLNIIIEDNILFKTELLFLITLSHI